MNKELGNFKLPREELAQKVAAHISGYEDAIAEQVDFEIADKIFQLIEDEIGNWEPDDLSPDIPYAIRYVKYQRPMILPVGKVIVQQSSPGTGKTERAKAWAAEDPENRRVIDGDRVEAVRLATEGYDVMLNLLPGM